MVPDTPPEQSPTSPAGLVAVKDPLHVQTPTLRCLDLRQSCPFRLPSPSPSKHHGISQEDITNAMNVTYSLLALQDVAHVA